LEKSKIVFKTKENISTLPMPRHIHQGLSMYKSTALSRNGRLGILPGVQLLLSSEFSLEQRRIRSSCKVCSTDYRPFPCVFLLGNFTNEMLMNFNFQIVVESQLSKDAKIIVACSTGGTMKPSMNLPEGQQSRY
jgi:hypothetical protein